MANTAPADGPQRMGVVMTTFLVAGNMIGSGVFLLPASLARFGSVTILTWLVTTCGAIALALTFSRLANVDPAAGGPYAYARSAFGSFIGYQTNLVYWFANIVGNVTIGVAAASYIAHFFPVINARLPGLLLQMGLIWAFAYANILGPRFIGYIQAFATSVKLVPILGVGLFGWFWFDPYMFLDSWKVTEAPTISVIGATLNMTLWAFIGVESAAVATAVVRNPRRNVPIATICGVLLAATCYILSSSVIMGLIPNAELQASTAPFADAAARAFGPLGANIVAACAAIGCLGSLGGWMLLVSQSAAAAAHDGLFGEIFSRVNRRGVPVEGIGIIAVIMSFLAFAGCLSQDKSPFETLQASAVILTLVPYLYSCISVQILAHGKVEAWRYSVAVLTGLVGAVFCILSLANSEAGHVRWAFIFLLAAVIFYSLAILRKHEQAGSEWAGAGPAPAWTRHVTLWTTLVLLAAAFLFSV